MFSEKRLLAAARTIETAILRGKETDGSARDGSGARLRTCAKPRPCPPAPPPVAAGGRCSRVFPSAVVPRRPRERRPRAAVRGGRGPRRRGPEPRVPLQPARDGPAAGCQRGLGEPPRLAGGQRGRERMRGPPGGRRGTVQHGTARNSTARRGTAQRGAAQHGAARHGAAPPGPAPPGPAPPRPARPGPAWLPAHGGVSGGGGGGVGLRWRRALTGWRGANAGAGAATAGEAGPGARAAAAYSSGPARVRRKLTAPAERPLSVLRRATGAVVGSNFVSQRRSRLPGSCRPRRASRLQLRRDGVAVAPRPLSSSASILRRVPPSFPPSLSFPFSPIPCRRVYVVLYLCVAMKCLQGSVRPLCIGRSAHPLLDATRTRRTSLPGLRAMRGLWPRSCPPQPWWGTGPVGCGARCSQCFTVAPAAAGTSGNQVTGPYGFLSLPE